MTPKIASVHAAYPQPPDNHFTYRIKITKEQSANKLLTNCPPCPLSFEQGLELMREAGEPMECGIFDFYKGFSRAFGEEGNGVGGVRVGGGGCPPIAPPCNELRDIHPICQAIKRSDSVDMDTEIQKKSIECRVKL